MEPDEKIDYMINEHVQQRMTDYMGLKFLIHGLVNSPLINGSIIVEIGTYRGITAALMGRVLKYLGKNNCILSIDPFEDYTPDLYNAQGIYHDYKKNIKFYGVEDICFCLTGYSQKVACAVSDKISFLAVDGSHLYDNVLADIRLYSPKVIKGGYIWLDDYNTEYYPGVVRAINETLESNQDFELIHKYPSFVLYKKLV